MIAVWVGVSWPLKGYDRRATMRMDPKPRYVVLGVRITCKYHIQYSIQVQPVYSTEYWLWLYSTNIAVEYSSV